jgi:Flp pilus assembly protein TadG
MIRPLRHALNRFRRDDSGNATVEFVIWFPMYLMILFAGVEAGVMMMRNVILNHTVDVMVRDLRLGNILNPTHDTLKSYMCARPLMMRNCLTDLRIELVPIDTATWQIPTGPVTCVDRAQTVQPVASVDPGQRNRPVLIRVCAIYDAIYPTTALGMDLELDESGGYRMAVVSAFVNQPR